MRAWEVAAIAAAVFALGSVSHAQEPVKPPSQLSTCAKPLAAISISTPSHLLFDDVWQKEKMQSPETIIRNLMKASNCFTDAWAAGKPPEYDLSVMLLQESTGDLTEMKWEYFVPFYGLHVGMKDYKNHLVDEARLMLMDVKSSMVVNGIISVPALGQLAPGTTISLPVEDYSQSAVPTEKGKALAAAYIIAFNQVVDRLKITGHVQMVNPLLPH